MKARQRLMMLMSGAMLGISDAVAPLLSSLEDSSHFVQELAIKWRERLLFAAMRWLNEEAQTGGARFGSTLSKELSFTVLKLMSSQGDVSAIGAAVKALSCKNPTCRVAAVQILGEAALQGHELAILVLDLSLQKDLHEVKVENMHMKLHVDSVDLPEKIQLASEALMESAKNISDAVKDLMPDEIVRRQLDREPSTVSSACQKTIQKLIDEKGVSATMQHILQMAVHDEEVMPGVKNEEEDPMEEAALKVLEGRRSVFSPASGALITDSVSYLRRAAVETLADRAKAGDTSAIRALCLALEDSEAEICEAAAMLLAACGRAACPIAAMGLGHPCNTMRKRTTCLLRLLSEEAPMDVFESIKPFFGNSKAAQHIVEILGGLGSMNVHEAWLALPPFLHHEDAAVREMAVKLLRNGSEFQMINGTLKTY
ncbi:unnamed protein product [Durusdinium trenchii]|uniref:Uncharacterized protein n=2 Tax=Durusdinium trenchii TaxID=1381693 RepID=A0ABP0LZJ6_9DINO